MNLDKSKYDKSSTIDVYTVSKGDFIELRCGAELRVHERSGNVLRVGENPTDTLSFTQIGGFVSTVVTHPFDIVAHYTRKTVINWDTLPKLTKLVHTRAGAVYFLTTDPTDTRFVIVTRDPMCTRGADMLVVGTSNTSLYND